MSGMMDDPPTASVPDTSNEDRPVAPQHQGVGVEDEPVATQDPGVSINDSEDEADQEEGTRRCSYTKGGVCRIHGPGAKYRWRKLTTPIRGPDGRLVRRQYYWECRPGPSGRRNLRQTTLSSLRRISSSSLSEDNVGGETRNQGDDLKNTPSLGQ